MNSNKPIRGNEQIIQAASDKSNCVSEKQYRQEAEDLPGG